MSTVALEGTAYVVVDEDVVMRDANMPPCPPDRVMSEQTAVVEKLAEYVQGLLLKPTAEGGLGFQEFWIPTDDAAAKCSILMTEDWAVKPKLLVVVQNASGAQMGIWSRSLAMSLGLNVGSMLPTLKAAMAQDFGIIVLRPNANSVYVAETEGARPRKMLIEGSSSPSEHALYVWDNVVAHTEAAQICLLGIGAGGSLAKELLQREMVRVKEVGEGAVNRIVGICCVEASHMLDVDEAADVKDFLQQFAVNLESSEAAAGYRLPNVAVRLGCHTLSLGPIPPEADGNTGWSPSAALESITTFLRLATKTEGRVKNLSKKFVRAEARRKELDPQTAVYAAATPEDAPAGLGKDEAKDEAGSGAGGSGLLSRFWRGRGTSATATQDDADSVETVPYDPANGPEASREVDLQENESLGVDDFDLLKVVGKGAFGKVMMVRKKENVDAGRIFAMKVLKKSVVVAKGQVEHTKTEKTVLMEIRHPYIVRLRYAFQSDDKLYLVTDYYNGGSLFYHLRKSRGFSEGRAKFYAAELLLSLQHLHSREIVYRDLKLENVLMDHDGHIALTDFGLSKMGVDDSRGASTFCGTAEYIAPELLRGLRYGAMVDWWSFGILLYEMMAGRTPFYDKNRKLMFYNIINCDPHFPPTFSDAACDVLRLLLAREPTERIGSGAQGADAIRAHAFFADIDFAAMERKELTAPFQPDVHSEVDTKYVPKSYLEAEAKDSIVAPSAKSKPGEAPDFTEFTYLGEGALSGAAQALDDGDDTDDA